MREANPRAHLNRLITDRNYLGAQLFLKEAELEDEERNELMGVLATSVVDELSRTPRDDRERLIYLRSVLGWVLREIPGLGSLYREQLRAATGRGDLLSDFSRGFRNLGDVASGRKTFEEGVSEAADDARRTFEGEPVNEFFSNAEKGIRDGLDQLGTLFRTLNEDSARRETRADSDQDVEDAEFSEEGPERTDDEDKTNINVERE